jgi:hypothetical protein
MLELSGACVAVGRVRDTLTSSLISLFHCHPWSLSSSRRKIVLDLQLADLAVQIVDDLLRIFDRRCLAAPRKTTRPRASPAPVSSCDHLRMNPKLRRQLRQALLPESDAIATCADSRMVANPISAEDFRI